MSDHQDVSLFYGVSPPEQGFAETDVITILEQYFRRSALSGEDALPRWATFSLFED